MGFKIMEESEALWREFEDPSEYYYEAKRGWRWSTDEEEEEGLGLEAARMIVFELKDGFQVRYPFGWCGSCDGDNRSDADEESRKPCEKREECPCYTDEPFATLEVAQEAAEYAWHLGRATEFMNGITIQNLAGSLEDLVLFHRGLLEEAESVRNLFESSLEFCRAHARRLKPRRDSHRQEKAASPKPGN